MNRFKISILFLALICVLNIKAQTPSDTISRQSAEHKGKVGLVLSGGGAKGIAHVGVIKALEDNDIPIDYVAGTSMGAIVGSLYSCGYSPEEMMKLFTSRGFASWSTGVIDKQLTYFFDEPAPTPRWVQVHLNPKDTSIFQAGIIPTNLINPLPMNLEFMNLYAPYTKQSGGNFNNLFVPFRCVTSDVYHKHKIVCRDGNLGKAVRASMSFPLVFKPIEMDGVLVYDGGIYDNFPVDVMHTDFNPEFMIGVSVSAPDSKPIANDVYSQLEDLIIQNNNYDLPEKYGVKIQVPVLNFGVLDFPKAREIYEIGYRTGLAMVDSIKARCPFRISAKEVQTRRQVFKERTPEVVFDSVEVNGNATKGQKNYLKFIFDHDSDQPLTMEDVKDSYYRAISGGKLSDLVPFAEPYKSPHILSLNATVKNRWTAGIGGWVTSSTNSMLYLSAGYHTLSFNSMDFDLSGWIGQSYYAGLLQARFGMRTRIPSYIEFQGLLSQQKYYDSDLLFYQTKTPTFISENENYARVNFGWAMGRKGKGTFSAGYGYISDHYYPSQMADYSSARKDRSTHKIFAVKAGYEKNTLDYALYPTTGEDMKAMLLYAYDKSSFLGNEQGASPHHLVGHGFGRAEFLWRKFHVVDRHLNVGWLANGVMTAGSPYQNYMATLIQAPAFAPTPATKNYFNIGFRADNYLAGGVIPIWKPVGNLQLRGDFYLFAPVRELKEREGRAVYDGWFRRSEFIGEVAVVYNFSFASLSLYGNYLSYPSSNWNFGISFGLYFQAPKFLR